MRKIISALFLVLVLVGIDTVALVVSSTPGTATIQNTGHISGSTVMANSGNAADIQSAVNTVCSYGGGIVYVPAGNFTFAATSFIGPGPTAVCVNITVPSGGLQLIGAGQNMTNITLATDESKTVMMFLVNGQSHGQFRMSGITLLGKTNASSVTGDGGVWLEACKDFRVDHCDFWRMGEVGIFICDHYVIYPLIGGSNPNFTLGYSMVSQGVIDHCTFHYMFKPSSVIGGSLTSYGYGVQVAILSTEPLCPWNPDIFQCIGNATWHTVIENCYFEGCRHAVASSNGGMYVLRFSTITAPAFNEHEFTGHPGRYLNVVGMRSYEIYNNTLDGSNPYDGVTGHGGWWKSGGGIFANNTIENLPEGICLCNADDNGTLTYPLDKTHNLWIYGNTLINTKALYTIQAGVTTPAPVLDTDFFLHEPNATQGTYTPIPYPDPLASSG